MRDPKYGPEISRTDRPDRLRAANTKGPENLRILKAIEQNTRIESREIESVHFMLAMTPASAIADTGTGTIDRTVDIAGPLKSSLFIFGFNYSVRWLQPFFATDPHVGIAISKYTIIDNLWTSTSDLRQEGMLHSDSYSTFPSEDVVNLNPPRYLNEQDKLYIQLHVDNITGAPFSKTIRFHLTVYYKLAAPRGSEF